MEKRNPFLTVIIPCYNEEKNLNRGVLDEVFNYLVKKKFSWEVLVCNDASTDKSLTIVNKFSKSHKNFHVLDLPKGGKPGAIYGGLKAAKGDIVLFTDMDQSTPIFEFDKLKPFFDQGYDFVIGSRGMLRPNTSLFRQLMSAVFLNFRRFLLLPDIIDTQCGFKAFKRQVITKIFPKLSVIKNIQNQKGWRVTAYDVEMLFLAKKNGYKIKEIAVKWENEDISDTKGNNTKRFSKESKLMAKEILRIKLYQLLGKYEKI